MWQAYRDWVGELSPKFFRADVSKEEKNVFWLCLVNVEDIFNRHSPPQSKKRRRIYQKHPSISRHGWYSIPDLLKDEPKALTRGQQLTNVASIFIFKNAFFLSGKKAFRITKTAFLNKTFWLSDACCLLACLSRSETKHARICNLNSLPKANKWWKRISGRLTKMLLSIASLFTNQPIIQSRSR